MYEFKFLLPRIRKKDEFDKSCKCQGILNDPEKKGCLVLYINEVAAYLEIGYKAKA